MCGGAWRHHSIALIPESCPYNLLSFSQRIEYSGTMSCYRTEGTLLQDEELGGVMLM